MGRAKPGTHVFVSVDNFETAFRNITSIPFHFVLCERLEEAGTAIRLVTSIVKRGDDGTAVVEPGPPPGFRLAPGQSFPADRHEMAAIVRPMNDDEYCRLLDDVERARHDDAVEAQKYYEEARQVFHNWYHTHGLATPARGSRETLRAILGNTRLRFEFAQWLWRDKSLPAVYEEIEDLASDLLGHRLYGNYESFKARFYQRENKIDKEFLVDEYEGISTLADFAKFVHFDL